MTTLLIVDDQQLIRSAVRGLIADVEGISVVAEAADGAEAVRLAERLLPDVVLMDIRMPVLDGIEATSRICSHPGLASVKVLILTTFEEDENVFAALRAGASGFIGKGSEPDEIVRAIEAVDAGDSLLSPAATRALVTRFAAESATVTRTVDVDLGHLTPREREMLMLVGSGLSNDEIAGRLFISIHTVKTHIKRVMTKLHARDRAQLVIIAYESGVLPKR